MGAAGSTGQLSLERLVAPSGPLHSPHAQSSYTNEGTTKGMYRALAALEYTDEMSSRDINDMGQEVAELIRDGDVERAPW